MTSFNCTDEPDIIPLDRWAHFRQNLPLYFFFAFA